MQVTTIGLDLVKQIFLVHGVGPDGKRALRKRLRRVEILSFFAALPPCIAGMDSGRTTRDRFGRSFQQGVARHAAHGRAAVTASNP